MMAVPLPMLFQTNLPLGRKLILGVLFSSGTFVIICAILRAYYSLRNIDSLPVALGWASRELLVASIVVCSPTIKPLVSQAKRVITDKSRSGSWRSHAGSQFTDNNTNRDPENAANLTFGNQKRGTTYKMSVMGRSHPQSESQDHINRIHETDSNSTNSNGVAGSGILVKTEFRISRQ